MSEHQFDLVVIGAGPGGYVAAIRAAQLGLNVACIEKETALGGTCLRVGCIPSKALLEASSKYTDVRNKFANFGIVVNDIQLDLSKMLKHKDKTVTALTKGISGLFKKNGISHYPGLGTITAPGKVQVSNPDSSTTELTTRYILIATGSSVTKLPSIEFSGDRIGTSTEALSYPEVPNHLVVIGAGVIGLELGSVWSRLGAKVTVVEYLDRILPGMDSEIAQEAQRLLKKQGLEFQLNTKVVGATTNGSDCMVMIEGAEPITADRVLVSVGRKPNTEGLGLENVGIETSKRGQVAVNKRFETSVPGIFAIGDVIEGPMLAHKAEEEGIACVEELVTGYGHVNYNAIPSVVYTDPEIASVGQTEEQLNEAQIRYRKGVFPLAANGRARSVGQPDGKIKVLADAQTDRILGVHIIASHAGDLIAEAVTAMEFGASSEDLARVCHAHPTMAEALKEAALAVDKRPIHI
ncbi:MAG: dihydrolipoyl dehydrogenase [Myxococcota bacterium]|nr:dihydrolipoyl dehydrogenase [Myxococcota bacterium]